MCYFYIWDVRWCVILESNNDVTTGVSSRDVGTSARAFFFLLFGGEWRESFWVVPEINKSSSRQPKSRVKEGGKEPFCLPLLRARRMSGMASLCPLNHLPLEQGRMSFFVVEHLFFPYTHTRA